MKLSEFLEKSGMRVSAFADLCGEQKSTIWRIAVGETTPRGELQRKIFLATDGAVEPNDYHDLVEWRAALASGEAGQSLNAAGGGT